MNLPEVSHDSIFQGGFTLVELLLVMSLVLIIGAVSFPTGIFFYQSQILAQTDEGLLSTLRRAQNLAESERHGSSFGVKLMSNEYILFEGSSFNTRVVGEDEVFQKSDKILVSGFDEIVFKAQSGMPNYTGELMLSYGDIQKTITVTTTGNVE